MGDEFFILKNSAYTYLLSQINMGDESFKFIWKVLPTYWFFVLNSVEMSFL